MAIACARCGTQNPDGNKFCQACGSPLAAAPQAPAAPVGATPAAPWQTVPYTPAPGQGAPISPPQGPAPAYQSPYYSPAAGGAQPPVHRTPWVIIIAVVVGLVVIMAGCGTVLAFSGFGKNTQPAGSFKSLSSPTPATTPTPRPSPSPTPVIGGAGTETNASETVLVPKGWTVLSKDDETITLESPSGDGSITVGSGAQSPPQSAQQNKDQLDAYFRQKFPDTKDCPGTKSSTGDMDGAKGIYWQLCFTVTSSSQSVAIGAPIFVGANASGSVYYAVFLESEVSNMNKFIKEAAPVLDGGIKWKL